MGWIIRKLSSLGRDVMKKNKWVSVKDGLPDKPGLYMVTKHDPFLNVYFTDFQYTCVDTRFCLFAPSVVAWRGKAIELPEPYIPITETCSADKKMEEEGKG